MTRRKLQLMAEIEIKYVPIETPEQQARFDAAIDWLAQNLFPELYYGRPDSDVRGGEDPHLECMVPTSQGQGPG